MTGAAIVNIISMVDGGWSAFDAGGGSSGSNAVYEMLEGEDEPGGVAFCERLLAPLRVEPASAAALGAAAVRALSATRGADADLPRGWRAIAVGPLDGGGGGGGKKRGGWRAVGRAGRGR